MAQSKKNIQTIKLTHSTSKMKNYHKYMETQFSDKLRPHNVHKESFFSLNCTTKRYCFISFDLKCYQK